MAKDKAKIFSDLERLANFIPAPLFWGDSNATVLGANDSGLQAIGVKREHIIGQNVYGFYSKDVADIIVKHNKQVIKEKKAITFEESIVDTKTGKTTYFLVTRAPLFDDEGVKVVGLIETSIDITDRKENEHLRMETELQKTKIQEQLKLRKIIDQAAHDIQSPLAILLVVSQHCIGLTKDKIFDALKTFVVFIPVSTFWLDVDSVFVGANKSAVTVIGTRSVDDIIGKTAYDLYPHDMSDKIVKNNQEVIKTGKTLSQEETIRDIATGETKYLTVFKVPLYDDKGDIVGLVGTMVDITAEKNADRLKLENERQKARLEEQENFRRIVDQVIHDIRSPLAALSIMMKHCENGDVPEKMRLTLQGVATSITDIANNLLFKYKRNSNECVVEKYQPIVVSLALLQILNEKEHQYKEQPVKFTHDFCSKCVFAFIKAGLTSFKRMISNLINNAVEALEGNEGEVNLKLNKEGNHIKIVIKDGGKGMPQEIVNKIMNSTPVTAGKKDGSGIGFIQIRETLQRNQGKFEINSKVGKGTEVVLFFPIIKTPDWFAKEIKLDKGDMVIILDDDESIHHAWDLRFKEFNQNITIKHFTMGDKAISFINNFSQKEKIFLLTDFELINQELNGIQAIEKTNIKRAIIVTSHFINPVIRSLASKNGVKLLPKPLASEVPIEIINIKYEAENFTKPGSNNADNKRKYAVMKNAKNNSQEPSNLKKIDVVLIDDEEMLVDGLSTLLFERTGKVVDKYYNPEEFLTNLAQYAKDTKIFMDNDFKSNITGIELAKQLHEQGYTNLYLFSGKDFNNGEIPSYLTLISKTDTDNLFSFVNGGGATN